MYRSREREEGNGKGVAGEVRAEEAVLLESIVDSVVPSRISLWADVMTQPKPIKSASATDASKLTFPLQLVIWLVMTALAVAGSNWASNASLREDMALMRSDLRDMKTRSEMQAQLKAAEDKAEEERRKRYDMQMDALDDRLKEIRGEARLSNYTLDSNVGNLKPKGG